MSLSDLRDQVRVRDASSNFDTTMHFALECSNQDEHILVNVLYPEWESEYDKQQWKRTMGRLNRVHVHDACSTLDTIFHVLPKCSSQDGYTN